MQTMPILWQDYIEETEIGRGGTADVIRVRHKDTGNIYAAKVLNPQAGPLEMLERLLQEEAKIHLAITKNYSPHIVKCIEAILDPSTPGDPPGLLLQYIDGKTLRNILVARRHERVKTHLSRVITVRDIFKFLDHMTRAIEHIHLMGYCHCDIKPENIIRDTAGDYYLMDFGIAQRLDTVADTSRGTPKYMSPEQYRGEELDERTDVYSFGVTMYELISGEVPFDASKRGSTSNLANQVIYIQPPPPSYWNRNLARGISDILLKALEKDPRDRFQTVAEFRDALKEAANPASNTQSRYNDTDNRPTIRAQIVALNNNQIQPRHLRLRNEVTLIGRLPRCDIKFPRNYVRVSRVHTKITWNSDYRKFEVQNQGRNRRMATRVNGQRLVDDETVALRHEDIIQIGNDRFLYEEL